MGKGEIISGGMAGEYSVALRLDTSRIITAIVKLTEDIANQDQVIASLNVDRDLIDDEIAALELLIDSLANDPEQKEAYRKAMDDLNKKIVARTNKTLEISWATLEKEAMQKRIDYLIAHQPADPTVSAWCADLTTNLTGMVGTIEVPGERTAVLIQPGYASEDDPSPAAFSAARDGQLQPALAGTPAGAFYNLAMLPGWQKWQPAYRFGAITAIDGDTCDIELESAESSQQEIDVNAVSELYDVPITYMT